jgi:integrase
MGRKKITGLFARNGLWIINKRVRRYGRIYESTGTSDRGEAEAILIHKLEKIRQYLKFGEKERRRFLFAEAAVNYVEEFAEQPSIADTVRLFKQLHPYIGHLGVEQIDDESLKPFKRARLSEGASARTINIAIQRVTRVLRLCALKWKDEDRGPWLDRVPMLELVKGKARTAYPLSFEEQRLFFERLPHHLAKMGLFKVNTGTREQEVCKLRWDWEVQVPEVDTSVFLIPADFGGRRRNAGVKNRQERLVILNELAKSVIESQRGQHRLHVFPYEGRCLNAMNDSAWKIARRKASQDYEREFGEPAHPGFTSVRVHDLKHTFGRLLRLAGVTFEDRQALLGHKSQSVTTDYSAAEIGHLIEQANKVLRLNVSTPTLTVLRRKHTT